MIPHAFADSGTYTGTLTVTPAAGDPGSPVSYPFTIDVLSTIGLNVPGIAATTGVPFAGVVATFPDNGTTHAGTTSATIAWGDGNTTDGTLVAGANGQWNVLGMHSYSNEGTNTISVTVHGITATDATAQGTATVVPPPTVATAATAVLSDDKTYVTLNVLGALGDQSESGLTYTWTQTSGPSGDSAPVFSDSNTNTAKTTLAYLSEAGTYTFKATIANAAGTTITSSTSSVTVTQVATSITTTPASAVIAAAGTETFSGVEVDQFGNPMATQPDLTWTVEPGGEGGTIDATAGTYTAASGYGADTIDVTDADNSAITGQAGVYDVTAAPAQPTGLTATAAETAVMLSWDPQQDAATYNVYRGTNSNGESATPIATGLTDPSFTDTNLTDGTTYYYTIKAINPIGGSSASAEASAAPAAVPVTGLTATPGDEVVNLSWNPALGAVSYNLYEASESGGEGSTPYQMGITGTSFTDPNTSSTMTNYYLVQPVYPSGPGEIDSSDETPGVQGEFAAPGAPSGLTATANGTNEIDLSWTAPSTDSGGPVDQYIINRSTDNGVTFTPYDQVDGTTTTYQDTGAADGTKYYYSITAANAVGNSDDSDAANATTVLAAPDSLTATAASATEIDLSWNNNSTTATGFTINRSQNGGGFTTAGTVDGTATTFNDTNLSPGTNYSYEIVATTATASSAACDPAGTITMPANVSGLTIGSVSSSSASFSWPTVTGASGYEIDRKDSSGDWEIYDSVGQPTNGDGAGYEDTDVQDGTAYIYRVLPYNDSGTSDEGSAPTLTATTPLIAPNNVNIVALSPTSIEVVWDNRSSSESGFVIQRSNDGGTTWTDAGSTSAGVTNFVDSNGLQPEGSYEYTVAATNSTGTSAASGWPSVTTPAVPPSEAAPDAPVIDSATAVSSSAIDVAVELPSDAATNLVLEASQGNSNNFAILPSGSGGPLQPDAEGDYAVTGLTANTSYSFRLGAILHGQIAYSDTQSATTDPLYGPSGESPATPSVSAAEVTPVSGGHFVQTTIGGPYGSDDMADIIWTGDDPYGVEGNGATGQFQLGNATNGSWKSGFSPSYYSPYDYTASVQVSTSDNSGFSALGSSGNVTWTDPNSSNPTPDTPVLHAVPAADNTVQLTWDTPSMSVGAVEIYRVVGGVATQLEITDGSSCDPAISVAGGPSGSQLFAIFIGSDGHLSYESSLVEGDGIPGPVQGLAATPFSGGVHLLWQNTPNNETGFIIQRSTDADFTTDLVTLNGGSKVGADVTSYDDLYTAASNPPQAGVNYNYRVIAVNDNGTSLPSQSVGATPQETVSVSALDPNAVDPGPDGNPQDGYLDFHRSGDLVAALTAGVNYAGTAVAGEDYSGTLPSTVTFPAGQQDVIVPVVPANGSPGAESVVDAQVATGSGYTAADGTAQVNLAIHGLTVTLDGGSNGPTLTGSPDGRENLASLTFTIPQDAPTGTTFTLSIATNRDPNAPNLVDVWTPDELASTGATPLFGNGLDSYQWTVGQSGSVAPPPTLSVGAIGGSDIFRALLFDLVEADPSGSGAATTKPANLQNTELLYSPPGATIPSEVQGKNAGSVIVGENIYLGAFYTGPGDDKKVSYEWNAGNNVVSGFVVSKDQSHGAPAAFVNGGQYASFYYFKGSFTGENNQVSVNAKIGGKVVGGAMTTFTVFAPTAALKWTAVSQPEIVGDFLEGIMKLEVKNLKVPQPFAGGTTEFVQLLDQDDRYLRHGQAGWTKDPPPDSGLDTDYPYKEDESMRDLPGISVPGKAYPYTDSNKVPRTAQYDATYDDTKFTDYVLFKPAVPGATTDWVPLRVISWELDEEAVIENGQPAPAKGSWIGVTAPDAAATSYPSWTARVTASHVGDDTKATTPPPAIHRPPGGG